MGNMDYHIVQGNKRLFHMAEALASSPQIKIDGGIVLWIDEISRGDTIRHIPKV